MSEQFDFDKIENFDDHISMSIPNYDDMIKQVINYIECLSQQHTTVLDIGCSTGKMLQMVDHQPHTVYLGIDNSNLIPMDDNRIIFKDMDIFDFEFDKWGSDFSVVTSIFTLQFLPLHKRTELLDKVFNKMISGGVMIVAEKIYMDDPQIESINVTNYLESKRGKFTDEQILDKAQQLTRTMSLRTETELVNELSTYGTVIPFWRNYSFVAHIVRKP